MKSLIHYTHCPVCGSDAISNVLQAKDHTVSGEYFTISECKECSLRFTQDVPDANSIGPYYKAPDYISHSNTSKGIINRVYKTVRERTLIRKRKLVEQYTGMNNGSVLDVGSGIGSFVHQMNSNGWKAAGLEPDPGARETAKNLYAVDLLDSERLYSFSAGSFDAITMWHALEHVHDLAAYLRQLKIILKPNGKLFVAVPNYTSKDAVAYQEHWAAYDVPRHLYHFSPASMDRLMSINDLRIIACKPMWYDSFYISLLSSKYQNSRDGKTGKPNWFGAFFNGMRSNLAALNNVKKCSSVIYVIEQTAV